MVTKTTMQKSKELFLAFFISMLFAFTGGNVTWSLVQDKLDQKYHLMDKEKSLEYFALGRSLPGILSLNAAILIGREVAGWPGAFAAAAGNIIPAFFGMIFVALSYTLISQIDFISKAISGIRVASVAIILTNAIGIVQRAGKISDWIIVILAFVATLIFNLNVFYVIVACGFFGIIRAFINAKRASERGECS